MCSKGATMGRRPSLWTMAMHNQTRPQATRRACTQPSQPPMTICTDSGDVNPDWEHDPANLQLQQTIPVLHLTHTHMLPTPTWCAWPRATKFTYRPIMNIKLPPVNHYALNPFFELFVAQALWALRSRTFSWLCGRPCQ